MGEGRNGGLRVHFDARVRLEFQGAKVTSDAGLLAVRELDDALSAHYSCAHASHVGCTLFKRSMNDPG